MSTAMANRVGEAFVDGEDEHRCAVIIETSVSESSTAAVAYSPEIDGIETLSYEHVTDAVLATCSRAGCVI